MESDERRKYYFEQYKLGIESVEKTSERRQRSHRFFILLLTSIGTIIAFAYKIKLIEVSNGSQTVLPIIVLWSFICLYWQVDLLMYIRSNIAIYRRLQQLETKVHVDESGSTIYQYFREGHKYLDEDINGKKIAIRYRLLSLFRRSLPGFFLIFAWLVYALLYWSDLMPCYKVIFPSIGFIVFILYIQVLLPKGGA